MSGVLPLCISISIKSEKKLKSEKNLDLTRNESKLI